MPSRLSLGSVPSLVVLLVAGTAHAETIAVDASGPDGRGALKKAAARARDGDRIEVAPGAYDGPVVISASVAIASGPAAAGELPRIEAASGGATIVVEGGAKVALTGLEAVWRGGPAGGSLRVRAASVRASSCRLAGGNARGIDVAGENATVVLVGGAVSGNAGGGILAREGATVTADGTELARNGGTGAEASGAGSRLELRRCRIVENGRSGVSVSAGAGVKLEGCEVGRNKGAGLLAQSALEARVEGGAFRANVDSALRIAATRRLEVRGALVVGGRTGLALIGGTAGTVEGTAVVGAEGHGVVVEGSGDLTLRGCLVARNGQDGVVARERPPALPGTAVVANAGVGIATRKAGPGGLALAPDSLVGRNGRDPEASGPVEAAAVLGDEAVVAALARLSDLATALAAAAGEEQGEEERAQVGAALAEATAAARARREAFGAAAGTIAVAVRDAAGSETPVAFDLVDASGKVVLAAVEGPIRVRAGSYRARPAEEPGATGEAVTVEAGAEATVLFDRPRTLRVRLEGEGPLVLSLKPAAAIRARAPRGRDRAPAGGGPPRLAGPDAEAHARLRALALGEARGLIDSGADALDGPAGNLAVRTLADWGDASDVARLLAAAAARAAWLELRIEAARGLARLAAGDEDVSARLDEAVAGRVAPEAGEDARRRARATSVVAACALVRGPAGGPPAARGALLAEARAAEGADGDPALVAFAVEALAAVPRPEEAPAYRDLLRYREPAAGPGAALRPPDTAGVFHRSLARRAAAEALARLGDPVGFAWLAASARRYDRFAVLVLADIVEDAGALLRAGFESDDPEWRLRAALLAADLSEPGLVGLLVDAYATEQRPGRRSLSALRATEDALYALGSPAPVPLEVGRLRGGGKGGFAAALRLARAGHTIALAPLLEWCESRLGEPAERARSAAVLEALGALDAPEARTVLERATAAKDPLVRLAAARALAGALERGKK